MNNDDLKRFYKEMEEATNRAKTTPSGQAQYAAIDPTKIPCKGSNNSRDPLCVAMKKTEEAIFKAAILSGKVIHSMQDLPNLESPILGSNNLRECIENMNHNVDIILGVLNSLLCTFGETYE